MMLQPTGPIDSGIYFRIAYAVAAVLYGGYTFLLWRRLRRTERALRDRGAGRAS